MEIEQDYSNKPCTTPMEEDKSINMNNYYFNENSAYSTVNHIKNFFFINRGKCTKKRNYNESLNSSERILIKEKEFKYLLKLINQIKLKLDSNNNYITKKNSGEKNTNNSEEKLDNAYTNFKIDYSIIDLNCIILQLYQSNNLSDELKKFLLKKLVDNAIKVERTFQNYFNMNNMPNKK